MKFKGDQAAILRGLQDGKREKSEGWAQVLKAKGAGRVLFVLNTLRGCGAVAANDKDGQPQLTNAGKEAACEGGPDEDTLEALKRQEAAKPKAPPAVTTKPPTTTTPPGK